MTLFKKKKKRGRPKQKTDEIRRIKEERIRRLHTFIRLIFFFLLVGDIYVMASLFSFWTGEFGQYIRQTLMTRTGGAILILLIFGAYVCLSVLLRKKIHQLASQTLATLFLFISGALLLGLLNKYGGAQQWAILNPGFFGHNLTQFFLVNGGFFGTLLFCFASLFTSTVLYGFIKTKMVLAFGAFFMREIKKLFFHEKTDKSVTEEQPSELILNNEETVVADQIPLEEQTPLADPTSLTATTDPIDDKEKDELGFDDLEINTSETEEDTIQESEVAEPSFQARLIVKEEDSAPVEGEALPEISMENEEGKEPSIAEGKFPPPIDLFGAPEPHIQDGGEQKAKEQAESIISTLADFDVQAELAEIVIGPTVIQFQIQLAPGIKVSKIAGLANDLAVALAVPALRVEAPIPGKPYVGVEIPNPKRKGVTLRRILESQAFAQADFNLPLPMGVRVDSRPLIIGLEDLPHLLVAGTTGSGKSVFVNSCIAGLCYCRKPEDLRFLMIDPKRVELSIYEHLPHMLAKPVTSPKKAIHALAWAVREMEQRYDIFAKARVRNLAGYNGKVLPKDKLPHIVIVVDELADLMFTAQKDVEDYICRLAQMARATGIHLLLATQRPSVNVVTGLIKANIPARVAFTLPSQADSRTIIDVSGAEKLLGKGDMLFVSPRYPRPVRLQSPFIEDAKSLDLINYMRNLFGDPEYIKIEEQGDNGGNGVDSAFTDDPLLEEAMQIILDTGIASASRLQRQLRIGFTRAARLIDTMEQLGIVGPPDGSKPREILVDEQRAKEIMDENL
jgi:S-DNA-T family DNA segregation ATPase FtsK/SpoIIIE